MKIYDGQIVKWTWTSLPIVLIKSLEVRWNLVKGNRAEGNFWLMAMLLIIPSKRISFGRISPSMKSLEAKFGRHRSVIERILKEMGLKKRARTQVPKVSPGQRQKERLATALAPGGSLRPWPGRCIIMDDESYFGLSRHSTASFYYEGNKEVPSEVKYKRKERYDPKLMVWAAVSPRGISYLANRQWRFLKKKRPWIPIYTSPWLPHT